MNSLMPSSWSKVALIFQREVRDQLRDRRTLFMIAVLPLLLYPFMGMSFMQISQFLKKNESKVLVVSESALPTDSPFAKRDGDAGESSNGLLLGIEHQQCELPTMERAKEQAAELIKRGEFDAVVCFSQEFVDDLGEQATEQSAGASQNDLDQQADAPPAAESESEYGTEPIVFYNAAKDKSRIAYERVNLALRQWRQRIVAKTLEQHQLSERATVPFSLAGQDLAQPEFKRAALWSKILPFVALMWALTGAFYPAVDLCAGEKERGTMETLLSSPAERSEIVWGKLLTIMLFSMTTSILNLICMVVTSTLVMERFAGLGGLMAMGPPPMSSMAWLLLALFPISAFFSALSLALATFARSTKEGQYYLMPLILIILPLMMLSMMPALELDLGSSVIPVTGVLLLLRKLMEGEYHDAIVYGIPVIAMTGACCLMAIRWAVDLFSRESVMFRSSEQFDIRYWVRQLTQDRQATPSVAAAILCGIVILMIRFFASLPMPQNWNGFVYLTAITLVAFIATPALIMAFMLTTDPRKTLRLVRPNSWWAVPAAAALAVCIHPLALAATAMVRVMYPLDPSLMKPFESMLADAPGIGYVLLLMAGLPAICEELAFRGFILSGLRHIGNKWRAIFISSLFFGIAHGILQQSITATIFGMVIAYIAIQSGSIFPAMAFHAVHNSLGILSSLWIPSILESYPHTAWLFQSIPDPAGGPAIQCFGPPITLAACILTASLLRWFRWLRYEPTKEEALHESLNPPAVATV